MRIPKYFLPLNNIQAIKEAVSQEMEGLQFMNVGYKRQTDGDVSRLEED